MNHRTVMTDKQPEALRLADFCDGNVLYQPAAAELRRLHALNQEWEAKAATWLASPEAANRLAGYRELASQRDAAELMSLALKAQRDELLEALKEAVDYLDCNSWVYRLGAATIAKVKGEKK